MNDAKYYILFRPSNNKVSCSKFGNRTHGLTNRLVISLKSGMVARGKGAFPSSTYFLCPSFPIARPNPTPSNFPTACLAVQTDGCASGGKVDNTSGQHIPPLIAQGMNLSCSMTLSESDMLVETFHLFFKYVIVSAGLYYTCIGVGKNVC